MQVEIWSDIMCPWCYIGKRRFEGALKKFEFSDEVEITWKSFQLNPEMATDPSKKISDYLSEVKGFSKTQTQEMLGHVTKLAAQEGLTYHFDTAVVANSFDAHRLIQMAKSNGLGDQAEEVLFNNYFTHGKNIADHDFLAGLGEEIGLNKTEVIEMLASDKYSSEVKKDIAEATQMGITGVPFFVVDKKYGISGAQASENFLNALKQIHSEWKNVQVKPIEFANGDSCDTEGNCD